MSRDTEAETGVKYPNAETEIKISLYMENFHFSGMHRLEEL
jgi:hypothetical protein